MFNRHCGTCAFYNDDHCQISRLQMNAETDTCSKHARAQDVQTCETCGRAIVSGGFFVPDGDNWHFMCRECAGQLNTCSFCRSASQCSFEASPRPDKYVQQTIRNGNMTTVTTVRNPEIIRTTCQNGCPCFSQDFGCMRQFNYCERMDHIYGNPDNGNESQ